MDVCTEQVYQRRITELTCQLAEREATIVELRAQVADMSVRVAALTEQVADLLAQVARLSKNASNSSKPPSSGVVKPPPPPLPPGEKRSIGGQKGQWCERIWSAIATCTQQQRGVFEFLYQTGNNHFAGRPTPSLLPSGP